MVVEASCGGSANPLYKLSPSLSGTLSVRTPRSTRAFDAGEEPGVFRARLRPGRLRGYRAAMTSTRKEDDDEASTPVTLTAGA